MEGRNFIHSHTMFHMSLTLYHHPMVLENCLRNSWIETWWKRRIMDWPRPAHLSKRLFGRSVCLSETKAEADISIVSIAYRRRASPQSRNTTASSRSGSSLTHSSLSDEPWIVNRSFHAVGTYTDSPCCHDEETVEHWLRSVGELGTSPQLAEWKEAFESQILD